MKTSLEKVSTLERKLNVEVPAEKVTATYDRIFKQIQKNAEIKGFRQGKAPLATIKAMYSDRAGQDVVQSLVQEHYVHALKEHSLNPLSYPDFEFDPPTDGKDFSFTAFFEIRPEVNLKKYEGLSVEVEKLNVDKERIDRVIENIQSSRANMVDVTESRPAQKGDFSVIDFKGMMDGKPLDRGAGENFNLELGANSFIEGFEEGVIGMKIGETKTLSLKFPDDYQATEIAGKPVEFEVTLKGLKKKELPEVTDDFIASLGGDTKTVLELRTQIRKDLEESEKNRIQGDLKNRMLKALVAANPVDVPNTLKKEQKEVLIADMRKRMNEQGINEEQFAEYVQKWDADFDNTAAEIVQSSFIVDAIAEKHQLHWTEEDVEKKIQDYAKQTGIAIEKIRGFYDQREQRQRLSYLITEEKVMTFLLEKASLKEVEASALSDKN